MQCKPLNIKCKVFSITTVLLFAFFILHPTFLSAQNKTLDSLLQVSATAKEDTTRINTLLALSYQYINTAPDTPP